MSELQNILAINAGQMAGRAISDIASPMIDTQFTPGAELPFRASTWLNIAGGVALELVGYKFLKGAARLGAVTVGSHMVSKVVNYAAEYSGLTPTRVSATRVVTTQMAYGTQQITPYSPQISAVRSMSTSAGGNAVAAF